MRASVLILAMGLCSASCGGSTSGGSGGQAGAGGAGGSGGVGGNGGSGGVGGITQCTPSKACAFDEWCDYADNFCGTMQPGICKKRPQACDFLYAPACTCAGTVEANECTAQAAGLDVAGKGGCTPPDGSFTCGQIFCTVGTQYCERLGSDLGMNPDVYGCKPLPAGCETDVSCACVQGEQCAIECEADAAGNLTLTCPGG